jgi:hypothetical protein
VSTDAKAVSTLRARLALRGVSLHEIEGDDGRTRWIATQHAMTRSFDDLTDLEQWVDRVDGRPRRDRRDPRPARAARLGRPALLA